MSDTNGFVFNNSYTKAMTAALNNIWESNRARLETGTVDPDETMAKIKKEMEPLGLEHLLEEAQKQMDAYQEKLKAGN